MKFDEFYKYIKRLQKDSRKCDYGRMKLHEGILIAGERVIHKSEQIAASQKRRLTKKQLQLQKHKDSKFGPRQERYWNRKEKQH